MHKNDSYRKALKEVHVILENMNLNDVSQIPVFVIKFLEDNEDKEYTPSIIFDKPLKEQNLMPKTLDILSTIYSLYLKNTNV